MRELPAGWGAPGVPTSAVAARTGLRVAAGSLIALFDTPLLAEAGLVEARVVRKALRGAAEGSRCRWTGWRTWWRWRCGYAGCWRGGDVLDGDACAAAGGAWGIAPQRGRWGRGLRGLRGLRGRAEGGGAAVARGLSGGGWGPVFPDAWWGVRFDAWGAGFWLVGAAVRCP